MGDMAFYTLAADAVPIIVTGVLVNAYQSDKVLTVSIARPPCNVPANNIPGFVVLYEGLEERDEKPLHFG